MIPKHSAAESMKILKRQKYCFKATPNSHDGWNKALTTLFTEPAFHDVIDALGVEWYGDSQWRIRFRSVGDSTLRDGPRYSRLMKALWDNFGPTFDDYGVRLTNNHTGQPVPIKGS